MINMRGTTYSRRHVNYTVEDPKCAHVLLHTSIFLHPIPFSKLYKIWFSWWVYLVPSPKKHDLLEISNIIILFTGFGAGVMLWDGAYWSVDSGTSATTSQPFTTIQQPLTSSWKRPVKIRCFLPASHWGQRSTSSCSQKNPSTMTRFWLASW